MAWKERKGHSYYYHSVRKGGRVRTEYYGRGQGAEMLAEVLESLHASHKVFRAELREAEQADLENWRAERDALGFDAYYAQVEALVRAVMTLAGFHRHDRGPWRRRRMTTANGSSTLPAVVTPPASEPLGWSSTYVAWLRLSPEEDAELRRLAWRGDPAALDRIREVLAAAPDGTLAEVLGESVARQVERCLVARAEPDNPLARAALREQAKRMRHDLAGPEPTATERILAERAALAYLHVNVYELLYQRERSTMAPAVADAHQRRIRQAGRMLNEALKTLATVRRLALPVLQVNLAENQVNTVGIPGSSGGRALGRR